MSFFNIDPALRQLCAKAEEKAAASFRRIDSIAQYNSEKVLSAFINNHVSESHFAASTGYGYGDRGREVLDQVLRVFGVASDHDLFSVQAEFAAMSHISNPYGDGYASVRIVDMLAQ